MEVSGRGLFPAVGVDRLMMIMMIMMMMMIRMLATSERAKLECSSAFRRPRRASYSSAWNAKIAQHLRRRLALSRRKKRKRRALRKRALGRRLSCSPGDAFACMRSPARCTASNFLSVFPLPIGHHAALARLRQGVQTTLSAAFNTHRCSSNGTRR